MIIYQIYVKWIYSNNELSFTSLDEVYKLTQTNYSNLDFNTKRIILDNAFKCLENGKTLGNKTIVGAGSVVTKSFPNGNCIIAGNPARVIKEL